MRNTATPVRFTSIINYHEITNYLYIYIYIYIYVCIVSYRISLGHWDKTFDIIVLVPFRYEITYYKVKHKYKRVARNICTSNYDIQGFHSGDYKVSDLHGYSTVVFGTYVTKWRRNVRSHGTWIFAIVKYTKILSWKVLKDQTILLS
jgi:hypothetical protein